MTNSLGPRPRAIQEGGIYEARVELNNAMSNWQTPSARRRRRLLRDNSRKDIEAENSVIIFSGTATPSDGVKGVDPTSQLVTSTRPNGEEVECDRYYHQRVF